MNFLQQALEFIFTAQHWTGPAGLGIRIAEHLQYTVIAVFFSALIAVPVGLLIGHTGRGTFLVVTGVNALRALPTLGVLLLGVLLWGLGLIPPTVALMLLGQTLLGAAIDQFGWLGAEKRPFKPRHALSFLLIAGGIAVMMLG
jgi:osmoprotectant transport system permease protein